MQCYRWAREAGFERINLDFIYGLSEQPMERWQQTLERAIELAPDHLSLYALTVEEGTKLAYDIDHGRVPEPDGDMQAAMYEWSLRQDGGGWVRAVRDLELVPTGAGVPAQPGLLAQRRVAGSGAGRAFALGGKRELPEGSASRTSIRRAGTSSWWVRPWPVVWMRTPSREWSSSKCTR